MDLRNGTPETLSQASPHSSLARAYKWAVIKDMPGEIYLAYADSVIRATYAQLSVGGTGDSAQQETNKKAAIVIGGVRVGAATGHRMLESDLNPTETVASGSVLIGHTAATRGTVNSGNGTSAAKHSVATGMPPLDELEADVANAMIFLGYAVPMLQGASLVNSTHHFLPTTLNIFAGTKKQLLNIVTGKVKEWITALGADFDDWAFHKACHPISPPRKRSWAKNYDNAAKLHAIGHGAASVRIPAIPSEAQGARAAFACIVTAAVVVKGMGHTITWEGLTSINKAVELSEEGVQERNAVSAAETWYQINETHIAFCAGIVQDQSQSRGGKMLTILKAQSIKKTMDNFPVEAGNGKSYSAAYRELQRRKLDRGEFDDPKLIF
jgi:hypothetical protein